MVATPPDEEELVSCDLVECFELLEVEELKEEDDDEGVEPDILVLMEELKVTP